MHRTGDYFEERELPIQGDVLLFEALEDRTTSIIEQRDALIEHLKSRYVMSGDVCELLRKNTDLAWILVSAREAVESSFGVPVTLELEVVRDPDSENADVRLFGYIHSPLDVEDSLYALKRFDDDWLLDKLSVAATRLNFDVAFDAV